jgi:hypothetical protein
MSERQEIEFIVKPDGTVEERVRGVSGPDCEKLTAAIEQALGEVERRERTTEYFNTTSSGETVTTRS